MRPAPCPRCAKPGGVPIAYGMPDRELMEQAERGEVHIGGCVVLPDAPDLRCAFCGREWRDGWVDVLRPDDEEDEEDDGADAWLTDEDRFERLVRDGEGSELPAVGDEWNSQLDALASAVLGDGSGPAWARYVWSHLRLPPIATELDMARARIRVVALGVLRRGFLDRLSGDSLDEWWIAAEDPEVAPYYLGYLAAV